MTHNRHQQLTGIAASAGMALGTAVVIHSRLEVPKLTCSHWQTEQNKYLQALIISESQIQELAAAAVVKMGKQNGQIFEAHAMILNDPELTDSVMEKMQSEGINAEWALQQVAETYAAMFTAMDDPYMKERALDVKDVSERMIRNMTGQHVDLNAAIEAVGGKDIILVAEDLTPSETCALDGNQVVGFVTLHGGAASHTAIIARALGIPAVVGVGSGFENLQTGDFMGVDGHQGVIHLQPSGPLLDELKAVRDKQLSEQALLQQYKGQATLTKDGHRVSLGCNIARPQDVQRVIDNDGEGVGLFRSEFLYMGRNDAPSEEEQYEAYKQVLSGLSGKMVVIRTLDVGGDKELPYLNIPKEDNPFLGYRAIRYCLEHEELFKAQLRALLRASVHGKLAIMFPMISGVEEIRSAKKRLKECEAELTQRGLSFATDYQVGIMIEIPSAAVQSDVLAEEVDFFSIGTNDLVQYTLAVDRMNKSVAHLYNHYHPAVLRLIAMTIENGHKAGKWVGMCGEAAGDIGYLPLLIGLGLDEFSLSPAKVLESRKAIAGLDRQTCCNMVRQAMKMDTAEKVKKSSLTVHG